MYVYTCVDIQVSVDDCCLGLVLNGLLLLVFLRLLPLGLFGEGGGGWCEGNCSHPSGCHIDP